MNTQQERISDMAHQLVLHRLKTEAVFGDMQRSIAARRNWTPDQIDQDIRNTIATVVALEVTNARAAITALDNALKDPESFAGAIIAKRIAPAE